MRIFDVAGSDAFSLANFRVWLDSLPFLITKLSQITRWSRVDATEAEFPGSDNPRFTTIPCGL